MNKSTKQAAEHYLTVKENYPKNQGPVRFINYFWSIEKCEHPADVKTKVVDETFDGNIYGIYNPYEVVDQGIRKVKNIQVLVLHEFIKKNMSISETGIDKMLHDHGIKLVPCPDGNPECKRLSSMRFGKILDPYAVDVNDSEKDRVLSKIKILVDETGYKLEDFLTCK